MALPEGSHAVRICPFSSLGDGGEVVSTSFVPHPGKDERAADRYLSVHWLEYLGLGDFGVCLARLRHYLLNSSPYPSEFKPTAKGKLAVLNCDEVSETAAQADLNAKIDFLHMPRSENVASSIRVHPDGKLEIGVAQDQAAQTGETLDPHSGLFTLPEEAAHQLAVQQHLARSVAYTEPGILPVRPIVGL